ncbi:MAG: hypothetical protein IT184_01835 [Acidobacteria bacterium]|nr:hypothetical protein [Acidobacteriota bacterium]
MGNEAAFAVRRATHYEHVTALGPPERAFLANRYLGTHGTVLALQERECPVGTAINVVFVLGSQDIHQARRKTGLFLFPPTSAHDGLRRRRRATGIVASIAHTRQPTSLALYVRRQRTNAGSRFARDPGIWRNRRGLLERVA